MEKKEARAEKDEAEKYQKLQDDHVSLSLFLSPHTHFCCNYVG